MEYKVKWKGREYLDKNCLNDESLNEIAGIIDGNPNHYWKDRFNEIELKLKDAERRLGKNSIGYQEFVGKVEDMFSYVSQQSKYFRETVCKRTAVEDYERFKISYLQKVDLNFKPDVQRRNIESYLSEDSNLERDGEIGKILQIVKGESSEFTWNERLDRIANELNDIIRANYTNSKKRRLGNSIKTILHATEIGNKYFADRLKKGKITKEYQNVVSLLEDVEKDSREVDVEKRGLEGFFNYFSAKKKEVSRKLKRVVASSLLLLSPVFIGADSFKAGANETESSNLSVVEKSEEHFQDFNLPDFTQYNQEMEKAKTNLAELNQILENENALEKLHNRRNYLKENARNSYNWMQENLTMTLVHQGYENLEDLLKIYVTPERLDSHLEERKNWSLFKIAKEDKQNFDFLQEDGKISEIGKRYQIHVDFSNNINTMLESSLQLLYNPDNFKLSNFEKQVIKEKVQPLLKHRDNNSDLTPSQIYEEAAVGARELKKHLGKVFRKNLYHAEYNNEFNIAYYVLQLEKVAGQEISSENISNFIASESIRIGIEPEVLIDGLSLIPISDPSKSIKSLDLEEWEEYGPVFREVTGPEFDLKFQFSQ